MTHLFRRIQIGCLFVLGLGIAYIATNRIVSPFLPPAPMATPAPVPTHMAELATAEAELERHQAILKSAATEVLRVDFIDGNASASSGSWSLGVDDDTAEVTLMLEETPPSSEIVQRGKQNITSVINAFFANIPDLRRITVVGTLPTSRSLIPVPLKDPRQHLQGETAAIQIEVRRETSEWKWATSDELGKIANWQVSPSLR